MAPAIFQGNNSPLGFKTKATATDMTLIYLAENMVTLSQAVWQYLARAMSGRCQ